jgi:hypothetical protein
MKLTLKSSGGISPPLLHPPAVDTSTLAENELEDLRRLLQAAEVSASPPQTSAAIRDGMSYTLTIEEDNGQRVLRQTDAGLTPAFDKLMAFIRVHAKKP